MADKDTLLSSLPADVVALLATGKDTSVSDPVSNPDGSRTYFLGEGIHAHKIEPLNKTLPDRVSQVETVVEPASFVDYVTQFKTSTAIFRASLSKNTIEAVLDYHGRAREADRDHALPQPLTHKITLNCPFDVDYAKWRKVFGQPLKQGEFAELIEDMIHTIAAPPASDLTEAINDLKVDRAVRFKSGRNERNGTVQLTYEEVDAEGSGDIGSGRIGLPQEIQLITSIFQGGPLVNLVVKLRYRLERGTISFILAVPGLDKIERDHFRTIGEDVSTKTGTPIFYTA
jgi:hypothetical protein